MINKKALNHCMWLGAKPLLVSTQSLQTLSIPFNILYKFPCHIHNNIYMSFFQVVYGSILLGPLNINIVSFNEPVSNNNIVILSTPIAKPPCGGQPYLKNSR